MPLNWPAQQVPPPYNQQYPPNPQQGPMQQWPPVQPPVRGQQPGWNQAPPYGQPPPYNQPPGWGNANPYWQQNMYGGPGAMPKKNTSGSLKYLLIVAVILLAVGGVAIATNGKLFSSTPSAAKTPVVTSFAANPATITAGQTANLTWDISGATSVSIDQGVGTVTLSGTKAVSPAATTTYTITASNSSGPATAKATVTVSTPAKPEIISFTANPETISTKPVTLQWNVTGATSVSIAPGIGDNLSAIGTTTVSPTTNTTYTLTATNEAGSVTKEVTVTLADGGKPIITKFTADPENIEVVGGHSILRWSVINASYVTFITPDGPMLVGSSDLRDLQPFEDTEYTLKAYNSAGDEVSKTIKVTVKK